MDMVLLTKRGISFQRLKRGEQTVILIPAPEQIKIYKDVSDTSTIAERYGSSSQIPLWRQQEGQTVVYGILPESLSQRRQAMKVYLAHDFAPSNTTAFYYVMDPRWVVHGQREVDDEGREGWQVILMKAPDGEGPAEMIQESASELMMENAESRLVVAVYENMGLLEELKDKLKPLSVQPVPFSSLKPGPRARPLYLQRDFTPLMLLGSLLAALCLVSAIFYWMMYWKETARLEDEMELVRNQIMNIQINQSIGNLREPDAMLSSMQKAFNQKPSAIMSAASTFGKEFGELEQLVFDTASNNKAGNEATAVRPILPGQHVVQVMVSKITNKLLVDQERLAQILVNKTPWIRRVENLPQGQAELVMDVVLQTEQPGETP
ncbi:MAG: hypothetical protein WAZ18_00265 [Alphaproteobacteria bacterium]